MTKGEKVERGSLLFALGLTVSTFGLLRACAPPLEPEPTGACPVSSYQCCQTWVEAPICVRGELSCKAGWTVCGAGPVTDIPDTPDGDSE